MSYNVFGKIKGMCVMTENLSSTDRTSLNALYDLESFFRKGVSKYNNDDNLEEENKTLDYRKRYNVTRRALNELSGKYNTYGSESTKNNAEEKIQNNDTKTNPLRVNTPEKSDQSALEIKRPETNSELSALEIKRPERKTDTNPLRVNTPEKSDLSALDIRRPEAKSDLSALEIKRPESNAELNPLQVNTPTKSEQSALEIKRAENETKKVSYSLSKQKNSILYELRSNAMQSKLTTWDIAKKYGISYIQAQEIFVELNQDNNGIVKEFNLPQNSTVSYLV